MELVLQSNLSTSRGHRDSRDGRDRGRGRDRDEDEEEEVLIFEKSEKPAVTGRSGVGGSR